MKRLRYWQLAIVIAAGFSVGAAGVFWYITDPSEDVGPNPPPGAVEADFRLPEYEGDIFTPQRAVYEGDKLVLTLRSNVLYPEPLEEVTLSKGNKRGTVIFDSISPGEFDVIVTNPPDDLDNAVLDLPAVSFSQYASISVDPTAETFTGPGDATYRITYRSPNRGSVSDSGTLRFRIDYEPDDPPAPSISSATIQAGEDSVYAIHTGGKFDASNRFIFGRLVFPIEAQELMERGDVELVITQYSQIVRHSVVMPDGLVPAGDRNAVSTSSQETR